MSYPYEEGLDASMPMSHHPKFIHKITKKTFNQIAEFLGRRRLKIKGRG